MLHHSLSLSLPAIRSPSLRHVLRRTPTRLQYQWAESPSLTSQNSDGQQWYLGRGGWGGNGGGGKGGWSGNLISLIGFVSNRFACFRNNLTVPAISYSCLSSCSCYLCPSPATLITPAPHITPALASTLVFHRLLSALLLLI